MRGGVVDADEPMEYPKGNIKLALRYKYRNKFALSDSPNPQMPGCGETCGSTDYALRFI